MASSTVAQSGGTIYFFRESEEPYGFLSQWYSCSFTAPAPSSAGDTAPQMTFLTTEQYMMYQKAVIFGDHDIANQIMLEPSAKKQKALGRKVKGFNNKKWNEERQKVVENGNWYKFTQPKEGDMKTMLLETGHRELVEASPFDRIWGVGYGATKAEGNRANWGENLLGKALMRVRDRLQEEEGKSKTEMDEQI